MDKLIEVLAWPVAALLFGIAALFIFRAPITALIGRTKRVGKDGLEAYDTHPAPPTEEKRGVEVGLQSITLLKSGITSAHEH